MDGPQLMDGFEPPPIVKIVDEPCTDDDYADCDHQIVVYVEGDQRISFPYSSSSERRDQLSNAVNSLLGELKL